MPKHLSGPVVVKPISLWQALLYCVLGSAALATPLCWIWGLQTGMLGSLIPGTLWAISVFSWRTIQKENKAHYQKLQLALSQSSPIVQLAMGFAQPLRSFALSIPIDMLMSDKYLDPGLCLLGRLNNHGRHKAQLELLAWISHVRADLALSLDTPLSFVQSIVLWQMPSLSPRQAGTPEPDATTVLYISQRIHLLLCAIDIGDMSPEVGELQLRPWVSLLQQRYTSWPDYAAAMKQARWEIVHKNLWGIAAQAVHFHDLLSSPLSPWVLVDFDMSLVKNRLAQ